MKTNRGKNKGKAGKVTNYALYIVPVVILMIVGWGAYKLLLPKPKSIGPEPVTDCAPTEPTKEEIHATIYFDTSASMKGYANATPNHYLDVIADLRSFYPGTDAVINKDTIPGNELIDRILHNKINYTGESLLYRDLEEIASDAQRALEDTLQQREVLNFYLTDGIMSGSNVNIHDVPEYMTKIAKELQNKVSEALMGKNLIGLSLYQFESKFDGKYWAYDNENHELKGAPLRYFYVIAVGSRPALANFKQKVDSLSSEESSEFHPLAQWHAIDKEVINTGISVGPNGAVNFNGTAYVYKPKVINRSGAKSVMFNIDTHVLRNQYIEDMDSLAKASIVEIDGRKVNNIPIRYEAKAHAFAFMLPVAYLAKQTKVRFTIPRLRYEWIGASTTRDDKYMFSRPDQRTFLFDKFMQGIQSGIAGASSPYIYQREVILEQE